MTDKYFQSLESTPVKKSDLEMRIEQLEDKYRWLEGIVKKQQNVIQMLSELIEKQQDDMRSIVMLIRSVIGDKNGL